MENIDFISLIPFVFITTFSPGPNNIACTSIAVHFGIKKSLGFFYGIFTGFMFVLVLAGFFTKILSQIIPSFEPAMRWIGATYILYLAYKISKAHYSFQPDSNLEKPFGFTHGFLLQFLNPKGIIYALTLYSTFLSSIVGHSKYIVFFGFILACIGFCSILIWAFFGNIISHYLHQEKIKSFVNLSLSSLLIYTAIKMTGLFF